MSEHGLALAVEKMRAAGVNETAVAIFSHYYRELEQGSTGLIPEADIAPLDHPDAWHDEPPTAADVGQRTAARSRPSPSTRCRWSGASSPA